MIWANHGANNRKRTTHDNYNGRQHRRPGCQHLSRRPQSPKQSCHGYLWMGDQESTSTSTTTPKNDLQKLASPHLRRHTSFWLPIEDTKDRPRGIPMTTFGRGIRNTHQPLQLHQRAIYRSHLVLNYDDNQASYKSSQGFKFENCDLFHLHKGSRWSWVVTLPHSTSSRVKDITVPHLRPKNPSPRESSKALANHSGHTGNPRQL